jgi:3,4-dihydroxyphenylacetate 2,3-dioxygenase
MPSNGVVATGVVAHVPTLSRAEITPEYQSTLVSGERLLGEKLRALKPELWVIISTHWVSTFNWFTTMQAEHRGVCIAEEAPDLIPGVSYHARGDEEFAEALIASWRQKNIPSQINKTPHFAWDYGTYVPLSHIDPDFEIPVLSVPVVLMADMKECFAAGAAIYETAKKLERRTVILASSAFSHALVRGREHWPSDERIDLDRKILSQLQNGEIESVTDGFESYAKASVVEMGGRAIATMLGATLELKRDEGSLAGLNFGEYAQSSGSGNMNIILSNPDLINTLKS